MFLLNGVPPPSLLTQLKPSWMGDFEERVKEFSAKLALVPIPPPGQLHVVSHLSPSMIYWHYLTVEIMLRMNCKTKHGHFANLSAPPSLLYVYIVCCIVKCLTLN